MKNIGLVGLGNQMYADLIPALLGCADIARIIAFCDIDPKKLDQTKKIFPNATGYAHYQELLEHESVDSIIVSVPHHLYFPITLVASKKGVAVFKEKPFAINEEEAKKFVQLYEQTDVPIYTVAKRRFYKSYQMIKKHLSKIGLLYQYNARHFLSSGTLHTGWRSKTKEAGGGILMDLGYHLIDITRDFFGMPDSLWMLKSNKGLPGYRYEVEDSASLLLSYPNGTHGSFQVCCYSGVKEESLEIVGSLRTIKIDNGDITFLEQNTKEIRQAVPIDSIRANKEALQEFFTGEKSAMTNNIKEHYDNMRIIEAAYRSAQSGIWSQL